MHPASFQYASYHRRKHSIHHHSSPPILDCSPSLRCRLLAQVYLFRQFRCVHVYECVSHARRWWYSLHFTTENRYCLRELQPSFDPRFNPPPSWFVRGAGAPYPKQVGDKLWSSVDPSREGSTSVAIIRDAAHQCNLSGGRETLVPPYLLHGLLPQALLETHLFWQDETPAVSSAFKV